LTISINKTWSALSSSDKIDGQKYGIDITNGATLTINESLKFHFTADIRVNGGCKLILQNSLSSDLAATYGHNFPKEASPWWKGIVVASGSSINQNHFTTNPNPSVTNNISAFRGALNQAFGIVELDLGSVIERAIIGINAYNGGIIESFTGMDIGNGPIIRNCHIGIKIEEHTPHVNSNGFSAYRLNSILFTTDNSSNQDPWGSSDVAGASKSTRCHILLEDVKNVFIGGCIFQSINQTSNNRCWDERGTGIRSDNSSFTVGEAGNVFVNDQIAGCTQTKVYGETSQTHSSKFNNLTKAIEIISNLSLPLEAEVSNCVFNNNLQGIVSDNQVLVVRNCNFSSMDDDLTDNLFNQGGDCGTSVSKRHIYIDKAWKSLIYSDTFLYDNSAISSNPTFGSEPSIEFLDIVGQKVLIQKNIIDGDDGGTNEESDAGIRAEGVLGSFEWVCNSFSDNLNGIILNDKGMGNIANPVSQKNANNSYSSVNDDIEFNSVNGTTLNYFANYSPSNTGNGIFMRTNPQPGEINCNLTCSDIELILSFRENANSHLILYPNPATNVINLTLPNKAVQWYYNIYNSNGIVTKSDYLSDNSTISISELENGIYFLILEGEGRMFSTKFTK
jgi:hypothetical protein